MTFFLIRRWSWLAAWAVSFGLTAEAAPPLAERLPADSCFVLLTEDFQELATAFRKTNLGSLATSEDLGPLVQALKRRDLPALLCLRPWFGFDWEDVSDVEGPGAIVIFPHNRGQFGAACLFDATSSDEAKTKCLASGERYFLAKQFRKSVVKAAGHELIVYEPPATQKTEVARVHFTSGNLFGAASTRAAAEALLATKEAASLAKLARFEQLTASISSDAPPGAARLFVRPAELWSLSRAASGQAKPTARDSYLMAKRQGLDGLQAIGGVAKFAHDKTCDIEVSLSLAWQTPLKKAMGLLAFKSGTSLEPPAWLGAETTSFATWQWDFPQAMQAFGNLFDELNEPGPDGEGLFDDLLSGLRDDPEGPRIDLRREFFARLGPQLLSITDRRGKPTIQDPHGHRALYIVSCRETPQVAALLKKFYQDDKLVKFEQLGDVRLWTALEGGSLFVDGEQESLVEPIAVAVAPGKLLFSTDADYLRSALAAKDPTTSLSNDGDWKQLREWLPTSVRKPAALTAFVRLDQFIEPAYRQLQLGKSQAKVSWDLALLRFLLLGTTKHTSDLPIAALPAFDRLSNRLRPLAVQITLSPEGQHLRGGVLGGQAGE